VIRALSLFFIALSIAHAQECSECKAPLSPAPSWPMGSDWPVEFIPVEKVELRKNPRAIMCKRPPEMLDTIVIHHTESPSTQKPQSVNDYHVNRQSKGEPWYMVAYSYLVSSPYQGENNVRPHVTEGRPIEIVGAHAGSDAYVEMSADQRKIWAEGKIICGKEGGTFNIDPNIVHGSKIKANVTTLGIVVIGNYSPMSFDNPLGHAGNKKRIPSKQTLELVAKMSCQLQKKYPGIQQLKWHSLYNRTTCPGLLSEYVEEIKKIAGGLGCTFK